MNVKRISGKETLPGFGIFLASQIQFLMPRQSLVLFIVQQATVRTFSCCHVVDRSNEQATGISSGIPLFLIQLECTTVPSKVRIH